MSIIFKNVKDLINNIDEFISTVEQGVLIFKEGAFNYLKDESEQFQNKIKNIERMKAVADSLQQKIDNEIYKHSILPQHSSDIKGLKDQVDEIIDISKENLYQFNVKAPFIPKEFINDYKRLTELSSESAMAVFPDWSIHIGVILYGKITHRNKTFIYSLLIYISASTNSKTSQIQRKV